jgi:glyoxylase-like metal-dependent hydrolase (beta-lactamase superfamily II)
MRIAGVHTEPRTENNVPIMTPEPVIQHPAYGLLRPVTPSASVLLADNPGRMRLDGTNTWILRHRHSAGLVVVDPGPADLSHITRIAGVGSVELILVSHRHGDHSAGVDHLVDLTGAPVRSVRPEFLRGPGERLVDGEVIEAGGLRIGVVLTPGHTADSACFVLEDAVLTADTILGRGTSVLDEEDGDLRDYLDSLRRLGGYRNRAVLPGHGPELADLRSACHTYLEHRHHRLEQVRTALGVLGEDASAAQIVKTVYRDLDFGLQKAALATVNAQLRYLRDQ